MPVFDPWRGAPGETEKLNHPDRGVRLEALRSLAPPRAKQGPPRPGEPEEVNNHIHTFYSFSPYSPSKAAWLAAAAGLASAGIMDHDSVSGAWEFIEAGRILGLATTVGLESRTDFSATPLRGRRLNNPDQLSNAYIALHGIPHQHLEELNAYFAPLREERNKRNRLMTEGLNRLFQDLGGPAELRLDFQADVVPLSRQAEGGSITERHLLYALAVKLIAALGPGEGLVAFLEGKLGLCIRDTLKALLLDRENPYYDYDLLGVLKSELVEAFYLEAEAECPEVRELLAFGQRIGAVPAYSYLGDVRGSVTGDKKDQKFEDDYLEELFRVIVGLGFQAVTYVPTRNSLEQLERVKRLCERYGLFQISGEDINSPRQSFACPVLHRPEFRHLIDSTWALIGHELAASRDPEAGMFSPRSLKEVAGLQERIRAFAELARSEHYRQGEGA